MASTASRVSKPAKFATSKPPSGCCWVFSHATAFALAAVDAGSAAPTGATGAMSRMVTASALVHASTRRMRVIGLNLHWPLVHEGLLSTAAIAASPTGAPVARRTVAGSLARGLRPKPQRRSQLRVSVGLAPTSPVPELAFRDRTQHPGCAQPLSREHPRDVTSGVQTRATTVGSHAESARAAVATWHAGVWLVWALAAAACVQLATSPVYVALVIGIAALAVSIHARPGPYARAFPVLVGIGVVFAVVRMVLTVATTHGLGTVLFTTPDFTLPQLLGGFTVGGTVELPVILQSLAEGFAIVGMMAVFGAFNGVVTHSELVQSTPRAFYEVGLVVVVALAFVPSTLAAIGDVRDADRARTGGRVVRRGRLLRQIVPILELGMERAVTLAESMDARGFARTGAGPRDRAAGWWGVASLLALGGAFVALIGERRTLAAVLGLGGAIGLAGAVMLASSGAKRARYRPRRMTGADWLVVGAVLAAPVGLAVCSIVGDSSLLWYASPLRWPSLHVVPALTLLPLLVPVFAHTRVTS